MPDISMCMNSKCEKRYSCYRYMAIPSEHWQSYGGFSPSSSGECKYYWSTEGHGGIRTLNEITEFEQRKVQAKRNAEHSKVHKLRRSLSQSVLRDPSYLD